jgi:cell division initiation protein
MKITPIEIRQHTFPKVLRGYDIDEVGAFLNSLSNEWERVMNEQKMLKMQLELAEKELNKLREVELTMFRMLKTAEDTSSQMTEQAKSAAEHYIGEARQKAEEIIVESRKKANMVVVDAENQSRYVREEILTEFKNHERDFKAMEKYRDNLLVQLKTMANNTNDSIERFEKKFAQNTLKEKIGDLRIQVTDSIKSKEADEHTTDDSQLEIEPSIEETAVADNSTEAGKLAQMAAATYIGNTETVVGEIAEILPSETKEEGSFFDQLG